MSRYDVKNKWQLPLEVTVRGQKTTGIVGIAFLGAPLALLALRYRAGRRLLVPGVLLGAMYLFNVGTRFLIPCLPFISLAMALALGEVRVLLAMLAIFHALTAWPAGIKKYANQYVWSLDKITYKQALRKIPQEKYLRENYGPYNVARMLDANVPPGQIVFSMNGIPDSYTAREVAVSFQSAWNEVLTDMVYNGFVEDYQPRKAFVFKFPEHLVRRVRVLNTTQCDEAEQWSVHELRFYDRGTELQRLPEWRVTAWPNPWDVQLAFDNSPATRWRSWETASPGMHMDVDFVSAKPIDEVHIDTSRDHQKVKLVIQTQDDAGRWTTLANNSEEIEIKPVGSVRRAATAELRARGVNYLLINDGDFGGQDMRDDPDGWGLEIVSAGWGATLYRVIP
jgi:hypothetical protein